MYIKMQVPVLWEALVNKSVDSINIKQSFRITEKGFAFGPSSISEPIRLNEILEIDTDDIGEVNRYFKSLGSSAAGEPKGRVIK
jgi:hypothetical protein